MVENQEDGTTLSSTSVNIISFQRSFTSSPRHRRYHTYINEVRLSDPRFKHPLTSYPKRRRSERAFLPTLPHHARHTPRIPTLVPHISNTRRRHQRTHRPTCARRAPPARRAFRTPERRRLGRRRRGAPPAGGHGHGRRWRRRMGSMENERGGRKRGAEARR